MSSIGTHRYRLEIAVQRLHDLVQLSASARVVFSARFLNFPEIFIRPQTAGGGGIAEPSPDGSRIVSLTYNVFHRADFNLSDDECRQCFPADCRFSVFDEAHPDALMTWTCPCPLTTSEIAAAGWNHMSYAMRNAAGQAVGLVNMSCRVVALDAIAPSGMAQAAKGTASSMATSPAIAGGSVTSKGGKPYVIRVVLDRYGNVKGKKIKKKSSLAAETPLSTTVSEMTTNPVPQNGSGLVVQEKHGDASTVSEQAAHRNGGTAKKKKTFLYVLQYDVAYQIQSNCSTLYATLKREFASLNAVSVSEKAKPMTLKLDNIVQAISRLANIALQLVNQLVESAGETYTDITSDAKGRRNPINKLSEPREGSVAHFLVYQVLFQLQCLGTNLCHVTSAYQSTLEVPLSTLHHQHYKFIHRLCEEVQELSKYINIIVQSTIDGSFGADPDPTYSSSFSSTRSKCSRLSSRSSSSSTHSTVESVHSIPAIAPAVTAATSLVKTPIPPVATQHNGVAPPGAGYAPPSNMVGTSALSPSAPPQNLKTIDGSNSLLGTLQQPPRPINATTTATTNGSLFPSPPMSTITTQAYTGTTALTGLGTGIGTSTGTTALTGLGTGIGTSTGTTALTGLGTGIVTSTGTTALTGLGTGIGTSTGTTALAGLGPGTTALTSLGTGIGTSTGTTALTSLGTGIGTSTGTTALTSLGTGLGTSTGTTALTSLGTGIGTSTGTTALTGLGTGLGTSTSTGMVDLPTPPPPPPHLPPSLPSSPIASVTTAPPSPLGPPPGRALAYTPPPPPSLLSSASQMMPALNTTPPTPQVESTLLKTALTPPALTQPTDSAHKLPVNQPPFQVSISPPNPPSLGVTLDAPVPPPVALSSSPISVPGSVPSLSSTLGSHIQVSSNSFTPSQPVPIPVPLPVPLSVPAVPILR